jgi:hypothetical protein
MTLYFLGPSKFPLPPSISGGPPFPPSKCGPHRFFPSPPPVTPRRPPSSSLRRHPLDLPHVELVAPPPPGARLAGHGHRALNLAPAVAGHGDSGGGRARRGRWRSSATCQPWRRAQGGEERCPPGSTVYGAGGHDPSRCASARHLPPRHRRIVMLNPVENGWLVLASRGRRGQEQEGRGGAPGACPPGGACPSSPALVATAWARWGCSWRS